MNSKLLKEAIADAKAVRETALANAKIALEEAFTPKLQSMLSKKLQEELEGDESEEEVELTQENDVSSEIGGGDGNKMPAAKAFSSAAESDELAAADVDKQTAAVGSEDENAEKVAGITEGEEEDVTGMDEEEEMDDVDSEIDEIIKELEAAADDEESYATEGEEEMEAPVAEPTEAPSEEPVAEEDEIDLDEILREMGYGDEPTEEAPVATEEEHSEEEMNAMKAELKSVQAELGEAINVIKSLKGTINEVNLLNAKLLYVNKLFRSFNLTNEQKSKVVETLDRTKNVREVKLVFSTIAESFKFGNGATKKVTAKLTESYASKPAASTAPKQIIAEDNSAANRFKKLAGIIK